MKILFITYDFPYPTNSGGKTRAYNLLKFAKGNNSIFLFSFVRNEITQEQRRAIINIGIKEVITFPRTKVKNPKHLKSLISPNHSIFYSLYFDSSVYNSLLDMIKNEQIDLVHFESFYTGYYLSDEISKLGVKQIYGSENIEYKLYDAYTKQQVFAPLQMPFRREVRKIKHEEEKMYRLADACLAITDEEKDLIAQENKQVYKIPNGVDLDYFTFTEKKETEKKKILFVGNFSYFPNIQAIRFFYLDVFAKLEHTVDLVVVGKHFDKAKLPRDNRVEHHEFIEDIHKVYVEADVFVSPVSIGGGTNFKILEALASGTPVIALSETGSAIGAKNGEEILLVKKENFLFDVKRLLENKALQKTLAKNGRAFIEKNYSWKMIGKNLNDAWHDIAKK